MKLQAVMQYPVVEVNKYLNCPSDPDDGADVKFKIDPVVV